MTIIRVDPDRLRSSAVAMGGMRDDAHDKAANAIRVTANAPSYDGQFGPAVRAIGAEASSRLKDIAAAMAERTAYLERKAADFQAADQAVVVGIGGMVCPGFPGMICPVQLLPDWLVDIIVSMIPFGDSIDILKQLGNLITGQDVDELVLVVSAIGLLLDAGYLEPTPAEEAGNLGAGVLKTILKRVPKGPLRDELVTFLKGVLKKGDDLVVFLGALGKLTVEHGKLFSELLDHPEALVAVLTGGSRAIEAVAKNEDFVLGLLKNEGALKEALKGGPEVLESLAKVARRLARAKDLMQEVAKISGVKDLGQYVDVVTHGGRTSFFVVRDGKRIVNLSEELIDRPEAFQLIEASHELAHAQQLEIVVRRTGLDAQGAWDLWKHPFGSAPYGWNEVIAEQAAQMRTRRFLGGLTPEAKIDSDKYIENWRTVNPPMPLP